MLVLVEKKSLQEGSLTLTSRHVGVVKSLVYMLELI